MRSFNHNDLKWALKNSVSFEIDWKNILRGATVYNSKKKTNK